MARLVSAHRSGSRLALLFDYDGTLTPIVEHPSLAWLEPGTRQLLQRLASTRDVGVAILSGRGLCDLRHLVALPDLYYAGIGGLELDLLGTPVTHPRAESYRGLVAGVGEGLREVAADHPGAWVEVKGLGLTLHYRQVSSEKISALWDRVGQILRQYAPRVRVVEGPMAWEVTPAIGWDKGTALRQIVAVIGGPAIPLYAGDGGNDTAAFEAVANLGGVSLGVGAGAPACAQHRLSDPAELVSFLTGLAEALEDQRSTRIPRRPRARHQLDV
jgi:trehalose 6-phosphate phosphatase